MQQPENDTKCLIICFSSFGISAPLVQDAVEYASNAGRHAREGRGWGTWRTWVMPRA